MKVIVVEIEKDVLKKCLQIFNITDQITFLDEEPPAEDAKYGTSYDYEPYYIEENIADLDELLILYNDVNYVQKRIETGEIGGFLELLLNIKKQRDIGHYIDDLDYIYKMGLRLNLPITYRLASELYDCPKDDDFYVITGRSDLGKMELHNRYAGDLTIVFGCSKTKEFTEMEFEEIKRWHPTTCIDALNDMIAIMSNDKDYFKNKGFSIFND
ncbi:MAG: hypothetical protein K2I75_06505 [Clostridiales bacterium]|nr:hypothetical protein [Clostridiales bacterium]